MKNIYQNHWGKSLGLSISQAMWQALLQRSQRTGESVNHIIQVALAAELDLEHNTIFQVSTATALVQGVYQGCVTVGEIKKHGTLGLGTFDELDGEGIMLDGEVWQAKSDGSLALAPDNATAPFWVSTNFSAQKIVQLTSVSSWGDLCQQIAQQRGHGASANVFVACQIKGRFAYIKYRVACKTASGTDLVSATSNQAVFIKEHCSGTLVGFWTPLYAKTLNVPGYHLHFISDDRQHGGHVLEIAASNLTLQLNEETNFKLALPESAVFLAADLSIDPSSALAKAEGS